MTTGADTAPRPESGHLITDEELRELLVLEFVRDAGQPLGNGTLMERLAERGYRVGDATAGRWLRRLQAGGYLREVGRRGRVLTERGRQHLAVLETRRANWEMTGQLARVLLTLDQRRLVDILVTRRGLEAEAAALAAGQARPEELQRLREAAEPGHDLTDPEAHGRYDLAFHHALADASGNPVLAAAIRLVRSTEPRFPVFVMVRQSLGHKILEDHRRVYEAIAARDAAGARRRMRAHLNHVIEDVHAYWRSHAEGS